MSLGYAICVLSDASLLLRKFAWKIENLVYFLTALINVIICFLEHSLPWHDKA